MDIEYSRNYEIAGVTIDIYTEEKMHQGFSSFLSCSEFPNTKSDYSITIKTTQRDKKLVQDAEAEIIGMKRCKERYIFFYLKDCLFVFDKQTSNYYAYNNFAMGKIEVMQNRAQWLVIDAPDILRSAFHFCVLDFLSLVFPAQNRIICHGAFVQYSGCATLLFGRSGAGKSTISYRLQAQDSKVEKGSDDTFVLFFGDDINVYPINTGNGYAPDIAASLLKDRDRYQSMGENKGKHYVYDKNIQMKPFPVRLICFLKREIGPDGEIETRIEKNDLKCSLRELLECQANIGGIHLKYKQELYMRLARQKNNYTITYVNDCKIKDLLTLIKGDCYEE